MDEQALVRRAQKGDQRAFEELVRAYEGRVYAVALRWTGSREDALDVSQEVFLRMYRFLDGFDGRSSLTTWLYRVAVNVCKDVTGRRARLQEQPLEQSGEDGESYATELPDTRYEPDRVYEGRARSEALREAIAALSDEYRAVIVLREVRGLSYQEIGTILSLEEGTVKSRISRAREKLRSILAENGNFFTCPQSKTTEGGQSK